ncbi:MAG: NusA-like transcription termination signal-binding factor [Candidatus Aenigmatarchaeota archaeon]
MLREFDNETILAINEFERLTGTEVRDCILNDTIYFLVNAGKAALAIGKGGSAVREAETRLKRSIRIYEWDPNVENFIKNMIPSAQKITVNGDTATVVIPAKDKGIVIGKAGANIKAIKELLVRNSELKELRIL